MDNDLIKAEIERLAAERHAPKSNQIKDAALEHVERDLSVIPINPQSKKPLIPWTEYQGRIATENEINQWWRRWPNANLGIVTGAISGIIVVDADNEAGIEWLRNEAQRTPLYSHTGRGIHAIYCHPGGKIPNAADIFYNGAKEERPDHIPKIDIRGDGGYIVAPPSIHCETGKKYQWEMHGDGLEALEDLPIYEPLVKVNGNSDAPKEALDKLKNGVSEGNRNDSLTKMVGRWTGKGLSFDEIQALAMVWNQKNNPPLDEKEVSRTIESIWKKEKSKAEGSPRHDIIKSVVDEMNEKHACIMLGGKFRVLTETINPETGLEDVKFSSLSDIRSWYSNQKIKLDPDSKPVSKFDLWLNDSCRKQYDDITFEPAGTPKNIYNFWKGFSRKPVKGDWSYMQQLVADGICDGNMKRAEWLFAWFAHQLQHPGVKIPSIPVLIGGQGTGKSTLIEIFGEILKGNFFATPKGQLITGRFNGHAKNVLLLYANEATWGGNRAEGGALKALSTAQYFAMEQKGVDAVMIKSHLNIIMDSNHKWVCPAENDERRFNVIQVNNKFQKDYAFFDALYDQMYNQGGIEAMMHDMLNIDISSINLREVERSQAQLEQIMEGWDSLTSWLFDKLDNEEIISDQIMYKGDWTKKRWDWTEPIPTMLLYTDYIQSHNQGRQGYKATKERMINFLKTALPAMNKERLMVKPWGDHGEAERAMSVTFPPIEYCKAKFAEMLDREVSDVFQE